MTSGVNRCRGVTANASAHPVQRRWALLDQNRDEVGELGFPVGAHVVTPVRWRVTASVMGSRSRAPAAPLGVGAAFEEDPLLGVCRDRDVEASERQPEPLEIGDDSLGYVCGRLHRLVGQRGIVDRNADVSGL